MRGVWAGTTFFIAVAVLVVQVGCSPPSIEPGGVKPGRPQVGTLPAGFQDTLVIDGRTQPTAIRFAPNGHVFVAEKSGLVFEYDDVINGPVVAHQVIDLRNEVHDFWDRGLLGLAVHPNYPATPEIYVLYAHDVFADGTGPRWGDRCPDPPGATLHGCVVYGRLSRVVITLATMTGTEVPLISGQWCHQYPSHSIGDLHFGPDGYLYASGGEGASFTFADYGQDGNPCGDPPNAAGTPDDVLATAQGGQLRSQDILTNGDPAGYGGSILRLDVSGPTVQIPPDNPLVGKGTTDDDAIIAIGLRNPFRWTFRPGTRELWIGDVGEATWEEVDRVVDPVAGVTNFGWPCYEGPEERPVFRGNVLCDRVYARNFPSFVSPMTVAAPYLFYNHGETFVPGEAACGAGSSSVSGIVFNDGTRYPEAYRNALFVADGSRRCIWTVAAGANGLPDPNARAPFLELSAGTIVDLEMGPDGRLYYVDFDQGNIYRFDFAQGNQPPIARVTANPTSGLPPLAVTLDASASTDAEDGANLGYAWDLDGDGVFNDGSGAVITHTFTRPGLTVAAVRVTDTRGASAVARVNIDVGNTPPVPVIASPAASLTWAVGDVIAFSGSATDAEDGSLPASALSWEVIMHHCRSEAMTDCHTHPVMTVGGVSSGSFVAPDHEWPSFLELRLTAFDSGSQWFNPAWPFRRALVVDSPQGSTLSDFPVLVTLTPARIDYTKVQAGGRDLRFTDAGGAVLSHEIESWNPLGTSLVWVRVPALPAASSAPIFMYYGNAAAANAQDPAAVWSNGYAGVWHLGASLADSSPHGRTGIGHATSAAAGAVGGGTAFDGVASFIDLGTSTSFGLVGQLTIEAWAKAVPSDEDFPRILSNKPTWDAATGFSFELNPTMNACTVLGSGADFARGSTVIDGQFHYYAVTIAGTTGTLYADGNDATFDTSVSPLAASSEPLTIGCTADGSFFSGVIDEVRLSSVARSRDWVAAQYRSMTDRMINYGAEEQSTALGQSVSVMLQPRTSQVSFGSDPAGLSLQVGAKILTTPTTGRFIVGSRQSVTAPSPQTLGAVSYAFVSWSDGQAATHIFTVAQADATLTAAYSAAAPVVDTDGDGMPDSWETTYGLDPTDPSDAGRDRDGDRLTNLAEFLAGSDPTRADSDGDGWDDFTEVTFGGNPIDPAVVPAPPQVAITAPAEGAQVTGPDVSVSFSIAGRMRADDRVGIALDGGTEVIATGSTGTVAFPGAASGAHTLRAQVRDAGGVAYTHAGASLTRSFTVASASGPPWFNPAWSYRRALVVDSPQGSTLSDFPVLVTLTPARIDYTKVQAGGRDLRFTDGSGAVLSHEIESWNPAGTSLVWVRVPALPAASSAPIFMYYGNAAAADAQDPAAVWSNGYAGVWHLGASLADSSPHGRTGIGHATSAAAGAVGGGTAFDGVASFIDLGTSTSFGLVGQLTIEAWAKAVPSDEDFPRILSNKPTWDAATGFSFELNPTMNACTVLGSGADFARGSTVIDGQFHYYAVTIAGTTGTLYADGNDATFDTSVSPLAASSEPLTIGRTADGSFFSGVIDEVRLSSVARSRDWVAAQYRSMTDRMINYGAEEQARRSVSR